MPTILSYSFPKEYKKKILDAVRENPPFDESSHPVFAIDAFGVMGGIKVFYRSVLNEKLYTQTLVFDGKQNLVEIVDGGWLKMSYLELLRS